MRIGIRLLCVDLPTFSGVQDVDIADNATILQAVTAHAKQNGIEKSLSLLPESMFLIGKKPARLDTELQDRDEVVVIRTLRGG